MISSFYEEITKTAYEIYEQNGREDGNDLCHWLEAERIVFTRCLLCDVMTDEVTALLEYRPVVTKGKSAYRPATKKPAASAARKKKIKK